MLRFIIAFFILLAFFIAGYISGTAANLEGMFRKIKNNTYALRGGKWYKLSKRTYSMLRMEKNE